MTTVKTEQAERRQSEEKYAVQLEHSKQEASRQCVFVCELTVCLLFVCSCVPIGMYLNYNCVVAVV